MVEIPSMKVLLSLVATPVKLNAGRIGEALVIAAITASATGYVAVQVLNTKVDFISARMDRVEKNADDRYQSIQEDVRRIYVLLAEARKTGRTNR